MPDNHYPRELGAYLTGVSPMNARYALTAGHLINLAEELTNPASGGFISTVAKLFTDPIDNISSIQLFPFDIKSMRPEWLSREDAPIKISNVTMNSVNGCYLDNDTASSNRSAPVFVAGRFNFSEHFHNFLDCSPHTKIDIWIPFIGFVPLDMAYAYKGEIAVVYSVDLFTGRCNASLVLQDEYDPEQPAKGILISNHEGQMSVPISFAGGSTSEIARRLMSFGLESAAATGMIAGTGNVAGGALQIGNAFVSQIRPYEVQKGGSQISNTSMYLPRECYAIITRPVDNVVSDFAPIVGRPFGKYLTLSSIHGYAEIDVTHLEGLSTALGSEIEEIESLLQKGVHLP